MTDAPYVPTFAAEEPPAAKSACDEPHAYAHHVRGGEPLIIPICVLCGEIGWDDIREQIATKVLPAHRRQVLTDAADSPDLHTVAAEALLRAGFFHYDEHEVADAVLAAVLPAHRRQVLAEAAQALLSLPLHDDGLPHDCLASAAAVGRLAETATPAPAVARQGDETAPPVPEVTPDPATAESAGPAGVRAAGWVPLAEVLAALRDKGAVERFAERHGNDSDSWYVEHVDRDRLCLYLAERFPAAPEGET